jgi:uncharacterized protein (DUF2164 family)
MPTQFDDLPYQIQLEIFEYAAFSSFEPRTVEIFYKDGVIYSNTHPPALLHVNQVSRSVVLKIYKPWLPQFKGTSAYKPFAKIAEKKVKGGISALQNVCVSLEHDFLVIIRQQTDLPSAFGAIECSFLRFMAIDVTGFVRFPAFAHSLRNVKNLSQLSLFEIMSRGGLEYKVSEIHRYLQREEEKDKKKPKKRIPNFVAPKLGKYYYDPPIHDPKMKGRCWVRYKYPAKDNSPSKVRLPPSPVVLDPESTLTRKRKSGGDEWAMTPTPLLKRAKKAISPSTYTGPL